jgi:hypothetical protein
MLSSPPKNVPHVKEKPPGLIADDDDRLYAVVVQSKNVDHRNLRNHFSFRRRPFGFFFFFFSGKKEMEITYFNNMKIKSAAVAVV